MADKKRLIDAAALRVQFDDIPPFIGMTGGCVQQFIDKAPTVDAVEVVHGRWITDGLGDGERICSVCRRYALYTHRNRYDQYLTIYCPNCGAKMDGDVDGA